MPSTLARPRPLLIQVQPSGTGWSVGVENEPPRHYQSKYWALQAAELIASHRHLADGQPTAVELQMPDGDRVLWRRFHTASQR